MLGNAEDPPARLVVQVDAPPTRGLWLVLLVIAVTAIGLIARRRSS
jgi:hypothetical protein